MDNLTPVDNKDVVDTISRMKIGWRVSGQFMFPVYRVEQLMADGSTRTVWETVWKTSNTPSFVSTPDGVELRETPSSYTLERPEIMGEWPTPIGDR